MQHKIDIIFLQEHNLKDVYNLDIITDKFEAYINTSLLLKGGTGILIRKNVGIKVVNVEYHHSTRIIKMKIRIGDKIFQLVNIYAQSGSNLKNEREQLFSQELLFYIQNNIDNLILGGDFNSIIRDIDASTPYSYLKSESIKNLCSELRLRNVHNTNGVQLPQYTYIKQGYGSRIDRFYVNKLKNNILDFKTLPVHFSDHHSVLFKLDIQNVKYIASNLYWKLNNSLLSDNEVHELFKKSWIVMKNDKSKYQNVLLWWESMKKEIADLFKKVGKLMNNHKYGLLNLLNEKLKYYNHIHQENPNYGFKEMQEIKVEINKIKNSTYDGLKIRARIDDKLKGETISSYMIGKQKKNADRYMDTLKINDQIIE